MSKFELPINYYFEVDNGKEKHSFTFNIRGDSFKEIVKNANELKLDLSELYTKRSLTKEEVKFQSGEDVPRKLE